MRLILFFTTILPFVFGFVACRDDSAGKPNVNKQTITNNVNKSVNTNSNASANSIPTTGYTIITGYKHDDDAFTQGLVFHDGFLYESTGQYGESTLRKVELETGKVVQKFKLDDKYFAEGMTILGDKIYQITWQEGKCFVYDLKTFKKIKEFDYNGSGWGLTNDGTNLIMSDGSHQIRYRNPETFEVTKSLSVFRQPGEPLMRLNELEFVKGEIWANVWHSEELNLPNHIARINPESGKLLGWINLDNISPDDVKRDSENTLNGIAYDEKSDRIFVTGKNWRKLYEIKLK